MKRPQDLVFRVLQHPLRLLSLRSIVILAQLGVIILVLTLGVWVWVGVTTDQYDQLRDDHDRPQRQQPQWVLQDAEHQILRSLHRIDAVGVSCRRP